MSKVLPVLVVLLFHGRLESLGSFDLEFLGSILLRNAVDAYVR